MSCKICPECNRENTSYKWCKPCNSKHFQNNFNNWTSGNDKINKFIQDAQLNVNNWWEVIEWIPYDRFEDVKQIGKGGFGTIHYARWIDGWIGGWDIKNQQWKRERYCDGKDENSLKNMGCIYETSIGFYGITQDPETQSYMMVLDYAAEGNLREYLKINFNNINWKQKLNNLWFLSFKLMNIHELDIVHQDFHPGNILSSRANPNNPEKKNIFGVLPYIAPEVLSGDEEYTKAADVYSFGIIAYEMVTGFPPYLDIPHDKDLAIKICNGLRPKIPFHIPKLITRTIMRCWDARVTHRPTFEELKDELRKYYLDYYYYLEEGKNKDSEIVIQIKKAEEFSANQNHTIYTSRLLNFSKLPKPKNEENFEKELEELTESTFSSAVASKLYVPDF
ncbi:hypothetical protein Glove_311g2 [Diversispora epigaea]|uniref:Protein kinase domain-containing protein n=1 Tax=Diversispora epigaea TaxID=1348612 RepID=A0A397HRD3_9GLOM|nr:hypothetical protein Glove_311g2 [Diversispora epigaea]